MATLASILSFARTQAQTDSTALTNAKGIEFANEGLADFHRRLVNAGVDASQLQEAYRDASVPSDGNGSTFLYPTDMLWLKAIECNYVNTNAQDYKLATQIDVSNISGQNSFSWLRKYADRNAPHFDDRGDWFEVFPAFTSSDNLTNAIRIFYYLKPTEYTTVADTIAYPESQDIRILGWRVIANYYYALNKFEIGDAFNAKYEERVRDYISTLARGSQQPIQASPIPWTGFEF